MNALLPLLKNNCHENNQSIKTEYEIFTPIVC